MVPQRRTIRKMDAAERALAYAEIRQLAAAYAFFTDAKDIGTLVGSMYLTSASARRSLVAIVFTS